MELLEPNRNFSKVLNSQCFILKSWQNHKQPDNQLQPWNKIRNKIFSTIIKWFKPETENFFAMNKLKNLVIHSQDCVSNRSFGLGSGFHWSDAHNKLSHRLDVLQDLSYILALFYILGGHKIIAQLTKCCHGCLKLKKKSFSAFVADMPDILKNLNLN